MDNKHSLKSKNSAALFSIIVGIILILSGLFIQIPGGALTTYESLDGDYTESYVFDKKYSSIDEYVGGDAYNFIIGASLVAGKISGTIVAKTICIVGGLMCVCFGMALDVVLKNHIPSGVNTVVETVKDIEANLPDM